MPRSHKKYQTKRKKKDPLNTKPYEAWRYTKDHLAEVMHERILAVADGKKLNLYEETLFALSS